MESSKFKILIVEDNPTDIKVLTDILTSLGAGFSIRIASSYHAAKENFQNDVPDLILLDIYLPDKDGFYFLQEIHQKGYEDIPVILLSAFSDKNEKLKSLELGATDFINKPVLAEELKARVNFQMRLKKITDDHRWASEKTNEGIKILYKELENKNKKLKELDQLKDEFINNVSHELRTPLTIIQGSVSIIKDGLLGEINEKQNKHLKNTLENIDRLGKIINDLLDISTIENRKMKISRENVNMTDLARKVVSDFIPLVVTKGLEIKCIVPDGRVDVFVDKDKIIQVLVNLVNNAYKFTDQGRIEVSVIENADTVECRVKDTGIGISESDLPQLFSKFNQIGRQHGAGAKGTGLGLSITKGIVELHDGQIKVESSVGQGTLFTVLLPRSPIAKQYKNLMDSLAEVKLQYNIYSVLAFNIQDSGFRNEGLFNELISLIKKQIHRKSDLIVRDNGAVFVVLSDTKKEDALIVLNRLRYAVDAKGWEKSYSGFKGFVIKVVSLPEDVQTDVELIDLLKTYKEAI
jgi:two-component system sensor histidine kinase/response regulator